MARVEVRERIKRSPEEVHDFAADIRRYPEWIPFTKEVVRIDGAPGQVGTRYEERGTGGRSHWTILEFERGRREVHEGDIGIARVRIEMALSPVAEGTDYRHVIEYTMKVPILGAIIDKLVLGPNMRRGTAELVANLKRILEAGPR